MADVTLKQLDKRFDKLEKFLETSFEAIGLQFQHIDGQFRQIDARFRQIDEHFEAMERRFDALEFRLERLEARMDGMLQAQRQMQADIDRIYGFLESIAKRQELQGDERLMLQHQLERLVTWARQVAEKTGIELDV